MQTVVEEGTTMTGQWVLDGTVKHYDELGRHCNGTEDGRVEY